MKGDLLIRWTEPDSRALPLLEQLHPAAVWLPWQEASQAQPFLEACRKIGIRPIAELAAANEGLLAQVRQAGFQGAALAADDEASLRSLIARHRELELYVFLKPDQIHWRIEPAHAVLIAGLWPGGRYPDPSLASATETPWLDANSYLVAWLRALFPNREALLGYRPDEEAGVAKDQRVPYSSVELAFADAAAAGGNWVISLPEHYRRALLAGEAGALEAWKLLANTAGFVGQHGDGFRQPSPARVVVAAGELEESGEILNLLYRHSVSPAVVSRDAIPGFGERRILVAVAVAKHPDAIRAALEFARAGGKVLTAPVTEGEPAWWVGPQSRKSGEEPEREFYELGQGTIIAYREPIRDPGEFALDVIDALGWRTRDLRLWGTAAVIGILHRQPGGKRSVELINYAGRARDFLVRLEGAFTRATLRLPGVQPQQLRALPYGSGTEVEVPALGRLASLLLA